MNDSDWPLTTERIERALAEVRSTPCPQSACCTDEVERVQFGLHIIAEKALAELLEHRAAMVRLEEWAVECDEANHPLTGSSRHVAAELRNRMKGEG